MKYKGLTSKEVEDSGRLHGTNTVQEAKTKTFLSCCRDNLKDGFMLLLLLCTFGGSLFGTTAFGILGWVLVILLSITVIPVDYIRKLALK